MPRAGTAFWRERRRRRGGNFFKKAWQKYKTRIMPLLRSRGQKFKDRTREYLKREGVHLVQAMASGGVRGLRDKVMADLPSNVSSVIGQMRDIRGRGISELETAETVSMVRPELENSTTYLPVEARPWLKVAPQNWCTDPVQCYIDAAMAHVIEKVPAKQKLNLLKGIYDVEQQKRTRGGIFPLFALIPALLAALGAKAAIAAPLLAAGAGAAVKGALGAAAGLAATKVAQKLGVTRGSGARAALNKASAMIASRGTVTYPGLKLSGAGSRSTRGHTYGLEVIDRMSSTPSSGSVKVVVKEVSRPRGGRPKQRTIFIDKELHRQIFG